jgi:hypothetical protein
MLLIRQEFLAQGASQKSHYVSIFEYWLELLPVRTALLGSIFERTSEALNMKDPSRVEFPYKNTCMVGSCSPTDCRPDLQQCANYQSRARQKDSTTSHF